MNINKKGAREHDKTPHNKIQRKWCPLYGGVDAD